MAVVALLTFPGHDYYYHAIHCSLCCELKSIVRTLKGSGREPGAKAKLVKIVKDSRKVHSRNLLMRAYYYTSVLTPT